ncbi:MAG: hypothetical protein MHMPM18_000352 [Marteilia pararefringens]
MKDLKSAMGNGEKIANSGSKKLKRKKRQLQIYDVNMMNVRCRYYSFTLHSRLTKFCLISSVIQTRLSYKQLYIKSILVEILD